MDPRRTRSWLAAALAAALLAPGRPAGAAEPPPVLLVHGWHGIADDTAGGSSMARLAERLAADGHRVAWAAGIGADPGETLEDAAATLGAQIAALGRVTRRPIVVVAHSYGGIVARAYLEGEGYPADFAQGTRVDGLVTLGTPMAGIDLWLPLLLALGDPLREPSVWQLTPAWMAAFNRAHRPRADVRLVAVAGDAREQAWPLRLLPPSDGVVTLASALALDPRRFGHAERVTTDLHAPFGPTSALGWRDLLTSAATYADVVRPAILGAVRGAEPPEPAEPSDGADDARAWDVPTLDMARGPVERVGAVGGLATGAGAGADATGTGGDAVLFVAAPRVPVAPGRSAPAGPLGDADPGLALTAALTAAPAGTAFDAGRPFAAAAHAAILARPAERGALGAIDALGFAAYAPATPHPVLRVAGVPGALRAELAASDGRPLAPSDAWLEVVGAPGRAPDWRGDGAGLVAVVDLPPGAYAVRAGAVLDGRRLEALATVAVPDDGAVHVRGAGWCGGRGGAALRADVEVARAGRYLIGLRGLDGSGRTIAATAGWRALPAGPSRVVLAAPAADRRPRRVAWDALRDEGGLVPAGGGEAAAGPCRPAGAPDVAARAAER